MSLTNSKKFFVLLFFSEMWERFSYYGMRALLVLYLTSQLGFADKDAYSIYTLFAALGYAGPVIGGIIADKLLGFRNVMKIGAVIITLGHVGMVFIDPNRIFMLYISLGIIAVGTGFFKGNITNLLGLCYAKDDPRRNKAFSLFYVSVNLGSFIASLLCGFLASSYGWDYGFGLAGIGMLIGLITFSKFEYLLGKVGAMSLRQRALNKKYKTKLSVIIVSILLCVICSVILFYSYLFTKLIIIVGILVFVYFIKLVFKLDSQNQRNMLLLMIITFFMMLFFSLEMQLGSLFNLFTSRNVDTTIFGYAIPAASLQSLNPLSIMLLGPLIAPVFGRLGNRFSIMRLGGGIVAMILSLLTLYVGCLNADAQSMVSIRYLILSMFVMGVGELFIAPLVHDLYTRLSPVALQGFMMGLLMLSLSFSNLAGNLIAIFVSVDAGVDGNINPVESLAIYQKSFLDFSIAGIIVLVFFTVLYPLVRRQYMSNFVKNAEKEAIGA